MTARTRWGRRLDATVAGRRWWTLDELVKAAAATIPPGVAWRAGEREQARRRPTGTGTVQTSDEARIRRGCYEIVRKLAADRVRSGRWETTGEGRARRWRAAR